MELLQDVVLQRAPQIAPVDSLFLGVGEEERHDDNGRAIDRHGHGHSAQVDAVEELADVVQGTDGDAQAPDFA